MEKIELINLTLDEIRRAAQMIESDRVQSICNNRVLPNRDEVEVAAECTEQLEQTRLALREVLEEIAEFINNHGMLSGVDCALTKVSFDLIYERKTDDDFE